jgi:multidrug efflux pump subunit AcrA (membrane-fusion protein)
MKRPAAALTLCALSACARGESAWEPEAPAAPPAPPAARPASAEVVFVGVVTTREHEVVPAEFEARVQSLLVHAGQSVRRGDPIARLDGAELQKQLAAARASEDAARAEVSRARTERGEAGRRAQLERRLHRRGAAAREEIRQAEFGNSRAGAGLGQARASLRKATAEREQLEERLARATLHAPLDGIVSMIRVKEGQVAPQGTAVASVFDPRDLWLRFAAEPRHRDLLKAGARVAVVIPGSDATVSAVVRHVSTDLEPPLQFLVADADIDDQDADKRALRVGSVGRVRLAP